MIVYFYKHLTSDYSNHCTDPSEDISWMMKLWSTFITFAAAWAMAVAWPKDMQADSQLLDNFMEYLDSESIKNEGECEIITCIAKG